ncbi:hypothetical protein QOT17_020891 [Balamuthia mandrillaris]
MLTSTPRPSVSSSRIFLTTSPSCRKLMVWVAPSRRDISRRTGLLSTAMIIEAPRSLAPRVAQRPMGPCAKTATLSPEHIDVDEYRISFVCLSFLFLSSFYLSPLPFLLHSLNKDNKLLPTDVHVSALSPAESGAHDVRAHQHLLIGQAGGDGRQVGHGIRHQQVLCLRAIDRVAKAPSSHGLCFICGGGGGEGLERNGDMARKRQHRTNGTNETNETEANLASALRGMVGQAAEALPAGRDGAHNHPLPHLVSSAGLPLLEARAELGDHPHGLVADGQPSLHGVLALEDVHVRPADGRGGDLDEGLAGAGPGDGLLLEEDAVGPLEDRRLHRPLLAAVQKKGGPAGGAAARGEGAAMREKKRRGSQRRRG